MIKSAAELIDNAVNQLADYKTGKVTPIKTRHDHINEACLGGIFKQMIITVVGTSGMGKSFLAQQIEEDMFDKELNPNCDNFILLRCNWEMSIFKILMRRAKRVLNKTMKHVLFGTFSDEDRVKFKKICELEKSGSIFYMEDPCTPEEWEKQIDTFLSENTDKSHILISIDHVALVKDGGNKKKSIDNLMEIINTLKKKYENVSFMPLAQLNREIEKRTDVRFLAPQRGDIYASDTTYHISDIVLAIHNPYKLGHNKYMVISGLAKDDNGQCFDCRYEYLEEYMDKPNSKQTSLDTKNVIFHHFIKTREIDDTLGSFKDVVAIPLDMKLYKEQQKKKKELQQNQEELTDFLR